MILSDRCIFVGAHVTKETKDAVRAQARKQKISVSEFVSRTLEEKLVTLQIQELQEKTK